MVYRLLFLLIVTCAASAQNWTLQSIQDKLKSMGIETKADVSVNQPWMSVPARVLVTLEGNEIQTYVYKTVAAREKDSTPLGATTAAPPTVKPHWIMPVSVVTNGNATLFVFSRVPEFHRRVEEAFASDAKMLVLKFRDALRARDVNAIEKLVSSDLVVFENGERNDGWADFRDNHLVPEMKEPSPEMKWEQVRFKETPQMAWGYTKDTFTNARGIALVLWSVYTLEKRQEGWKIVALDWSIGRDRAAAAK